jgi:hypothetical protein
MLTGGDGLIFAVHGNAVAKDNNVVRFYIDSNNSSHAPIERVRINSYGDLLIESYAGGAGKLSIGLSDLTKRPVGAIQIFGDWFVSQTGIPISWNTGSDLKYLETNYAFAIGTEVTDGRFSFFLAPSGTAGTAVTFTESLAISQKAILSIGTNLHPITGTNGIILLAGTAFATMPASAAGLYAATISAVTRMLAIDSANVVHDLSQGGASANSTGGGTALLGANSPAITNTAPYTWLTMVATDGSTIYVPAWK